MAKLSPLKRSLSYLVFIYPRLIKFDLLSDIEHCIGHPQKNQPILMCGQGTIRFGRDVVIGTKVSPFLHNGYAFLNARNTGTEIWFEDGVWANNNLVIICEGEGVHIGRDTLIGTNVEIYDSDFHAIPPLCRKLGVARTGRVCIGNNVWLGSNVKVLKGVTIGDNTIIANGAIVTKSIPENVVAGGIPAEIIRDEIEKTP